MAKVHILTMTARGQVNALVHFTMPGGANAAGTLWKDAALAEGLVGNEAHPMATPAEVTAIAAGDLVELRTGLGVNPEGLSGADLAAAFEAVADKAIAGWIAQQKVNLKHYGRTQGVVS